MTGKVPVNVEHIDGKPNNSREGNLTLLCPNCHSLIPTFGSLNIGHGRCNGALAHLGERRTGSMVCDWCGKDFETTPSKLKNSKKDLHFCTRSCKDTAQRIGGLDGFQTPHYGIGVRGLKTYRERVFREKGEVCCRCGYSGDSKMLDADHIDEDRSNNNIENLQVLCVWCHAIKNAYPVLSQGGFMHTLGTCR